jgi:hypothetical protein
MPKEALQPGIFRQTIRVMRYHPTETGNPEAWLARMRLVQAIAYATFRPWLAQTQAEASGGADQNRV